MFFPSARAGVGLARFEGNLAAGGAEHQLLLIAAVADGLTVLNPTGVVP